LNDNVLRLFSEGEGKCGFAFDVNFEKVLVIDDFHYALAAWQSGGDFWSGVLENNPDAEETAKKLGYQLGRSRVQDDYGMWEGELADNLPAGVEAIILPGFDSQHHNAEAEMAVTELGCSKLIQSVAYVYIRGKEYDDKDGLKLLNNIKVLVDHGLSLDEALEEASKEMRQ